MRFTQLNEWLFRGHANWSHSGINKNPVLMVQVGKERICCESGEGGGVW